jgi:carboxymethylenebutenolidase
VFAILMARVTSLFRASLLALTTALASGVSAADPAQTVSFESGGKVLHGLLYQPAGRGPFPAVLYNHGSASGLTSNAAFEAIAPVFVAHGWVFFAPYRRGQGLSQDAGRYVGDEISAAWQRGGAPAAAQTLVRLLSGEQLDDQMAALAWLQRQPFVERRRIAVDGNSFGGIEALLGAAHGGYCAAVDAAGGAESWDKAPALQTFMTEAAARAQSPILFIQAQNDFSLAPSRELHRVMQAAAKPAEIHLYAPFGDSPQDGHSFTWRGVAIWKNDVLDFLDRHCPP